MYNPIPIPCRDMPQLELGHLLLSLHLSGKFNGLSKFVLVASSLTPHDLCFPFRFNYRGVWLNKPYAMAGFDRMFPFLAPRHLLVPFDCSFILGGRNMVFLRCSSARRRLRSSHSLNVQLESRLSAAQSCWSSGRTPSMASSPGIMKQSFDTERWYNVSRCTFRYIKHC